MAIQRNPLFPNIYVHVPKTGGTSLKSSHPFTQGSGHENITLLKNKAKAQKFNLEKLFSWGFVRNPYDRLYSFYWAAVQHATRWPVVEEAGSFENFVLKFDPSRGMPHCATMAHFLCDHQGQIAVDFVGRFEHIERDYEAVCLYILGEAVPLKHVNISNRNPENWREAYTKRMKRVVEVHYDIDFRLFHYDKES